MATDRTPTIEEVEGFENLLDSIFPGPSDESAIRSLNDECLKSIEDVVSAQFRNAINCQEDMRREQELLKGKKNAENWEREEITPELIRKYKINHYCSVCEKPAAFVCCLHTSYCSSHCQVKHAEYHQRFCSKNSNLSPVFTVHRVRRVITSASATIISSNSEGCDSRTMTTLTHHKKVGIKRVACTSPPDNSDDSHSSKSKRCDH